MDGQGPAHADNPPAQHQLSPRGHGHAHKRQRSSGPDGFSFEDMFGGNSWRYSPGLSPVSDPDIDYNPQSAKRYLSEVMASTLTRHMHLNRPNSHLPGTTTPPPPGSPADDIPSTSYLPATSQAHSHLYHLSPPRSLQSYGAPPLTPPGICSPPRTLTAASELSDGHPQPMLTSDVSLSQGKASGNTAESISETADSEPLEDRYLRETREGERSVGGGWCSGWSGAAGRGGGQPGPLFAPSGSCGGAGGRSGSSPFTSLSPWLPVPEGTWCLGPAAEAAAAAVAAAGSQTQTCMTTPPPQLPSPTSPPRYAVPQLPVPQVRTPSQPLRGCFMLGPPRATLPDIPSSPSDSRFLTLDLRKTALLRSYSKRTEEGPGCDSGGCGTSGATFGQGAGTPWPVPSFPSAVRVGAGLGIGGAGGAGAVVAGPVGALHRHGRVTTVPVVSRSGSMASEGMSEGGGGCVGGMETSSTSADGGGGAIDRTGAVGSSEEEGLLLDEQQPTQLIPSEGSEEARRGPGGLRYEAVGRLRDGLPAAALSEPVTEGPAASMSTDGGDVGAGASCGTEQSLLTTAHSSVRQPAANAATAEVTDTGNVSSGELGGRLLLFAVGVSSGDTDAAQAGQPTPQPQSMPRPHEQ